MFGCIVCCVCVNTVVFIYTFVCTRVFWFVLVCVCVCVRLCIRLCIFLLCVRVKLDLCALVHILIMRAGEIGFVCVYVGGVFCLVNAHLHTIRWITRARKWWKQFL